MCAQPAAFEEQTDRIAQVQQGCYLCVLCVLLRLSGLVAAPSLQGLVVPAEAQIQEKIPYAHRRDGEEVRQVEVKVKNGYLKIEEENAEADSSQAD